MVQSLNICPRSEPIQLPLNSFQAAEKLLFPFRCKSAMVSSPNTYMRTLGNRLEESHNFLAVNFKFPKLRLSRLSFIKIQGDTTSFTEVQSLAKEDQIKIERVLF